MNGKFCRMTVTLNHYHLKNNMPAKAFTVNTNVVRKYVEFNDTYTRAFQDFLSALDALSNAWLTHQVTALVAMERYLRAITYDLHKSSPNYKQVFRHKYSYYTGPLVSFANHAKHLLVKILILIRHIFTNLCYFTIYIQFQYIW